MGALRTITDVFDDPLQQLWLLAGITIALTCGAVIGAERQRSGHPAGMRTHMLVAGAACLITQLGVFAVDNVGDPSRGMHAAVTGISFLGGGLIFTQKGERGPSGLTSAASVFYVCGLGCSVGMGLAITAGGGTLIALVVLRTVKMFDDKIRGTGDEEDLTV